MAGTILTFDLGTTFVKAALFDRNLKALSLARLPLPTSHPRPGRHEVPIEEFHRTIGALTERLREDDSRAYQSVQRISFATQTNSFVLLDERDQPITPMILWTDRRAETASPLIEALSQQSGFYDQTGLPSWDGQFMPAKLDWLRTNEPALFGRARRLCLIGDYLTFWLTDVHVAEAGAAGLTGLIDIHRLRWREPVVGALGLDHVRLPRIKRAGAPIGNVSPGAAERLGLGAGARVYLGCLDQYSGALAAGIRTSGELSETTGTALAAVTVSQTFDPALRAAGIYQGPSFRPGSYYRMMVSGISAGLLEAYRRARAPQLSYDDLDELAGKVSPAGSLVTLDVPATLRQGQPVFTGQTGDDSHGEYVLAIYRAIADELAGQARQLCGSRPPDKIICSGGGARSRLLRELKSRATGIAVTKLDCEEPTSLGAAILCCRGGAEFSGR